jgi:hypothetical protein
MSKDKLFDELSRALKRDEAEWPRLSAMTRISLSSLDDTARDSNEWYATIPLYKVRFLCSVLRVDFDHIFSVPRYENKIEQEWKKKLEIRFTQLVSDLYMSEEFWRFLLIDSSVLNIYPFQWTHDIVRTMEFDLSKALALLAAED